MHGSTRLRYHSSPPRPVDRGRRLVLQSSGRCSGGIHDDIFSRLEREPTLVAEHDILLARRVGARGPGAGPDSRADRSALASAREPADQRAETGAAADERHVALAVPLALRRDRARVDVRPFAVDGLDRIERKPQIAGVLQPAGAPRRNDAPAHASALREDRVAVYRDRIGELGLEALTRARRRAADRLQQAHRDGCPARYRDRALSRSTFAFQSDRGQAPPVGWNGVLRCRLATHEQRRRGYDDEKSRDRSPVPLVHDSLTANSTASKSNFDFICFS